MIMKLEDQILLLSRTEVVTKEYDSQGRVVRETWQYYHPKEDNKGEIGFTIKTPKKI